MWVRYLTFHWHATCIPRNPASNLLTFRAPKQALSATPLSPNATAKTTIIALNFCPKAPQCRNHTLKKINNL